MEICTIDYDTNRVKFIGAEPFWPYWNEIVYSAVREQLRQLRADLLAWMSESDRQDLIRME